MANQINSRIIHKHDTEANWNKATSFIPKQGEIIIYDIDDNYTYERFKIGDGKTIARLLPFVTKGATKTVSGEVISVSDSSNVPLKEFKLFGKTTQDGTPTPDAPIDLVSPGDDGNIAVSVCGKNLAKLPEVAETLLNGVTFSCRNGVVKVKGTATAMTDTSNRIYYVFPKGIKGTFFVSGSSGGVYVYVSVTKDGTTTWHQEKSFVLDGTETEAKLYTQIEAGRTVDVTVYPMLNFGTSALPYEPYIPAQTLTVQTPNSLPGLRVNSGGNYIDKNGQRWMCDEIDLQRGVYIQRIARVKIGDVPSVTRFYTSKGDSYRFDMVNCGPKADINYWSTAGLCNAFAYKPDPIGANAIDNVISTFNNTGNLYARCDKYTTPEEFKAAAKANGWEAMYIMETPVETQLDTETIAAYRALHTNEPYTAVYNDDNAPMEMTYYLNNSIGDMCLSIYDSNRDGIVNAADYASSATKAVQDANGNVITTTYATISAVNGKAPTSHASADTTYGAASASNYGHAKASGTTPKANGTAAVGTETSSFARGDHVHPLQTSVSGSAGSLATTRYIDGISFNGSANVTRYATCSTAAATVAKTASITEGTFSLVTGARVTVKFTYANSVANPTLNIGSTGAKAIYWHGAAIASSQYWQAGAVLDFIYNGTQWDLIGIAKDNNNTYTVNNATITISPGTGLKTGGSFTTNQSSAGTITLDHSNSITSGSVGSVQTPSFGGTFAIPKITYDAQGHITAATTVNVTLPETAPQANSVQAEVGEPSSATYYYPLLATGKTKQYYGPRVNSGIALYSKVGTTSAAGTAHLGIGNSTASGTAGNMGGAIYIYGTGSGYTYIKPSNNSSANYTLELPSVNGTLLSSGAAVTVAQGGTGATTASGALTNLGIIISDTQPSSPTEGMIWLKI